MNYRRPRLSIGLPVYNAEKYLRRAVDSLLGQTFEDLELILSDNASEDATPDLCREYEARDPRVRYYQNGVNLGASKNFNRVFQAACGEYFMWAAHDDWCDQRFAEECIKALDHEHEAVLCYTYTNFVDEKGSVVEVFHDTGDFTNPDPGLRYLNILSHLNWCNCLYGVMRTSVVAQTPLLQRNNASADNLFLADMALRGRFIQLEPALFYRTKPHFVETQEQRYARIYAMDCQPGQGITLPFCRWIKMHCHVVKDSNLSVESKNRLIQLTIGTLLKRYERQIQFEIQRAIGLIIRGRIQTDWDSSNALGGAATEPLFLSFVYKNALLAELDFAFELIRDFPGLNHARAILYLMLGRNDEGIMALERELQRDPGFQPSQKLHGHLQAQRSAAAG
jgi:glycosyltransferase involved in cell wall biosynthesis